MIAAARKRSLPLYIKQEQQIPSVKHGRTDSKEMMTDRPHIEDAQSSKL